MISIKAQLVNFKIASVNGEIKIAVKFSKYFSAQKRSHQILESAEFDAILDQAGNIVSDNFSPN